jgi:hypothetical protein
VVFALAVAMPAIAQRQPGRSPHGPLTIPCENCHTNTSWTPIRAIPEFNHDSTRYPLRGLHEKVSCTGCHLKPVFTDVGKKCADCHADIHRAQFGTNCAQCHTVLGWQVSVQSIQQHFNRFPLLGAHAVVECQECHKNAAVGNYLGLSTACSSCHLTDWQQTTNPVHPTAGAAFAAANCSTCHSFDSWANAKFDHSTTGFLLTAGHANVACTQCHINNNYTLTIAPTDCGNSQCHLTTWQQTNNPVHPTAGAAFAAVNCATCHTTAGWTAASFDHSVTGFLLTNGHANVACTLCHVNNNYTLNIAPTACGTSGCHLTTWQNTNAPPHSAAGSTFAVTNCAGCHTTVSFNTSTFDHSTMGFTLTGMHVSPSPTPCASCHVSNNFRLNSKACYGCHLANWQSTATIGGAVPNHITAGYPTDCSFCHSTTNWTSGTFNHNTTGFPLTGAHTSVTCALCHVGGNFNGTLPKDCYGCHTAQWQSTTTLGGFVPNHITFGYPTTCTSCHTTTSWLGAAFNHSTTGFPLTGAHVSVSCNLCHTSSAVPPKDCYSCHTAAWQSTSTLGGTVPNHLAADATVIGIVATSCASCHTTTNWLGATIPHGFFNLNHHGINGVCATCHTNPANSYTAFACSNGACHPQAPTTSRHLQLNISGYVYSTGATCYACHRTG